MSRRLIWLTQWLAGHWFFVLLGTVIGLYLFLSLPLVWQGPYNPDEGWYLHSAWLLWHGEVPYRDFGFPQSPLVLVGHGLWQRLLGPGFYVGRVVNVILGGVAIGGFMELARRAAGWRAGVGTGVLLAASPWYALQMATVSTYATTLVLLAGLLWAWYRQAWVWVGVGVIAVVATRFSLLPLLVVVPLLWLFFSGRREWRQGGRIGVGMGLGLLVLVGPWVALAGESVWHNVAVFHFYTRDELAVSSSIWQTLSERSTYLQGEYRHVYGPWWLLASIGMLATFAQRHWERIRWAGLGFVLALSVSVVHVLSENITYDVPVVGLLALVGGIGLESLYGLARTWIRGEVVRSFLFPGMVAIGVGLVFFPTLLLYEGFGHHEESHWNISRIARYIQQHSGAEEIILTPELYIALEAQRPVVPGMEMGRFFYFPEFSSEQAEAWQVLTDESLLAAVASRQARFVVFNQQHWWNRLDDDGREAFLAALTAAGYEPVVELLELQPRIELTQVYERSIE